MEENNEQVKKNNSGIIVLLVLIILALLGYILYDKVLSNKEIETTNDTNQEVVSNEEKEKLPEWAEYLLSQDITEIIVNRHAKDDPTDCPEPEQITKEQLRKVLNEMTKGTLIKNVNFAGGFGGPCMWGITVKYGDGQQVMFVLNEYIDTEDKTILELLEKEKYTANVGAGNTDMYRYEWYDYEEDKIDTLLG